jgi:hypothetical protein
MSKSNKSKTAEINKNVSSTKQEIRHDFKIIKPKEQTYSTES